MNMNTPKAFLKYQVLLHLSQATLQLGTNRSGCENFSLHYSTSLGKADKIFGKKNSRLHHTIYQSCPGSLSSPSTSPGLIRSAYSSRALSHSLSSRSSSALFLLYCSAFASSSSFFSWSGRQTWGFYSGIL